MACLSLRVRWAGESVRRGSAGDRDGHLRLLSADLFPPDRECPAGCRMSQRPIRACEEDYQNHPRPTVLRVAGREHGLTPARRMPAERYGYAVEEYRREIHQIC